MSQVCPICGKPVDAIRSRFVNVRDGKIVAYDSEACRSAAETKPTQVPIARRTPATGVVAGGSQMLESGPVIEIIREPASAPVAKPSPVQAIAPPPVADGSLDSWASGDHDEGDDDHDDDASPKRKRAATPLPIAPSNSRTTLVILLIAVLGGGGAFLAYRFLLSPKDEPEQEVAKPVTPPPPPPADAAPPPVPAGDAVKQARAVLVKNLGSESPRVQRVAAAALARTGDPQALTYLTAALAKETSDVSRLDLAYALARAGDKKGLDTLVAGLQSARRDVRAQAGRQLALVGDRRAAPVLAGYLEVSQLRLGAAEQLAYLADPAAIKALDQVRADPKSTADEKARATIALGIAGRSDVIPELQAMLKDQRFNSFAASALAQLRDATAKPVLVEQLALPSLRVEAARALRRLDPRIDPAPYLPALLAALASHKDTEQVQVAEAILMLAGDAGWSERP
jgi:HEAT repeat protein